MYVGPERALLALDILFKRTLSAKEVASAMDRLGAPVRSDGRFNG
jgi:hypothetical protein